MEHGSGEWMIDAAVVEMVSQMKANLQLTIYSPLQLSPDKPKKGRNSATKTPHSTSKK